MPKSQFVWLVKSLLNSAAEAPQVRDQVLGRAWATHVFRRGVVHLLLDHQLLL